MKDSWSPSFARTVCICVNARYLRIGTCINETSELEARYQITERWGVIPFVGVGATASELNEFGSGTPRWAGGVGIRYTIARKMRLTYGIDIARGPEDWAMYFKVGSGL